MHLLDGFTAEQAKEFYRSGAALSYDAGDLIFAQGSPADGLFFVMSGRVEVFLPSPSGDQFIAAMGVNEIFGEMGLLLDSGVRTASVRAIAPTRVFFLFGNPIKLHAAFANPRLAVMLTQNLIAILAERLRRNNARLRAWAAAAPDAEPRAGGHPDRGVELGEESRAALERVRSGLPISFVSNCTSRREYQPLEYIFMQGDEGIHGFYYFHNGRIQIIDEPDGEEPRVITLLEAPSMAGEIGYFTQSWRRGSAQALTRVNATFFSGRHFSKVLNQDLEEGLRIMHAAAQWTVIQLLDQTLAQPRIDPGDTVKLLV